MKYNLASTQRPRACMGSVWRDVMASFCPRSFSGLRPHLCLTFPLSRIPHLLTFLSLFLGGNPCYAQLIRAHCLGAWWCRSGWGHRNFERNETNEVSLRGARADFEVAWGLHLRTYIHIQAGSTCSAGDANKKDEHTHAHPGRFSLSRPCRTHYNEHFIVPPPKREISISYTSPHVTRERPFHTTKRPPI